MADLESIEEQINRYNIAITGYDDYVPLEIRLQNSAGIVIAGASAYTWGGMCEISFLWVDQAERGRRLGWQILEQIEQEAEKRGCHKMIVSSYSFQAPGFYQKYGFHVIGIHEDCPRGQRRFHLEKTIEQGAV